jgi:acyl-CoA synthetase (AMP-forming)/AMP-acid ligase II
VNILDPILSQCRINPAMPALCAPGTPLPVVSYGRLAGLIDGVAHRAQLHALKPGMVVAILCGDPILHAVLVLGLTRLGIVTLSARDARLPAECDIAAVITDVAQPFENAARVLVADKSWLTADVEFAAPSACPSDQPCRIILTSGTTGDAKGVSLSHQMIFERVALHGFAFGAAWPRHTRIFCDLGPSTSLGFLFMIDTLMRGGMFVFRGADASQTMQSFGLYRVEAMIASPAGLAEFVDYYERSPAFTSPFDLIITAGSLLPRPLSERVRTRLGSNLMSLYGSTEASMVATAPAHAITGEPNAVGHLLPGVTVQATDPASRPLPAGQKGLLRIRTERMATGYVGASAQSHSAFRDGWFHPEDIGAVTADNMLLVFGRDNAVINLGGDKLNPETIEQAMLACPGVLDAAAFSAPNALGVEELRVAVVADGRFDESLFRQHSSRVVPAERMPSKILRVQALPRNAAGKLDRMRLAGIEGQT